MSEGSETALSESELITAQELFEQLDIDPSIDLEWRANAKTDEIHSIPALGIEMRYGTVAVDYDETSYAHYWSYTIDGLTMALLATQDSVEYRREHAEPGSADEDAEDPAIEPVFFSVIDRETILKMGAADCINIDRLMDPEEVPEHVYELLAQWNESGGTTEIIWLFLSNQLVGYRRRIAVETQD